MNRLIVVLIASIVLLFGGCASNPFGHSGKHGALKDDASAEVTILRAKEMEKKGDWSGATVLYRAAVDRKPDDKALKE